MLEVRNLAKSYKIGNAKTEVLSDVSFELNQGMSMALEGESGKRKEYGSTSYCRLGSCGRGHYYCEWRGCNVINRCRVCRRAEIKSWRNFSTIQFDPELNSICKYRFSCPLGKSVRRPVGRRSDATTRTAGSSWEIPGSTLGGTTATCCNCTHTCPSAEPDPRGRAYRQSR